VSCSSVILHLWTRNRILLRSPPLGDHMHHTSSACPSVCPMGTVSSKTESHTTFKHRTEVAHITSDWQSNFKIKRYKVKVIGGRNFMIVFFGAYVCEKCIDSCKSKTSMTHIPCYISSSTVQQRNCILFQSWHTHFTVQDCRWVMEGWISCQCGLSWLVKWTYYGVLLCLVKLMLVIMQMTEMKRRTTAVWRC